MTDPATAPLPDASDRRLTPMRPLVLLAADDAVVCVDDLCVSLDDEAGIADAAVSQEGTR